MQQDGSELRLEAGALVFGKEGLEQERELAPAKAGDDVAMALLREQLRRRLEDQHGIEPLEQLDQVVDGALDGSRGGAKVLPHPVAFGVEQRLGARGSGSRDAACERAQRPLALGCGEGLEVTGEDGFHDGILEAVLHCVMRRESHSRRCS